jgi:hypothetical protein
MQKWRTNMIKRGIILIGMMTGIKFTILIGWILYIVPLYYFDCFNLSVDAINSMSSHIAVGIGIDIEDLTLLPYFYCWNDFFNYIYQWGYFGVFQLHFATLLLFVLLPVVFISKVMTRIYNFLLVDKKNIIYQEK